jgi:hypothetical protein
VLDTLAGSSQRLGADLARGVGQYRGRLAPAAADIDLGYHARKNRTLVVEKGLTPMIARLAKPHVKVATDGSDIDRRGCHPTYRRRVRVCPVRRL